MVEREWYWLLLWMQGYTLLQIAQRCGVSDEIVRRAIKPLIEPPCAVTLRKAKRCYIVQVNDARKRAIAWEFTFDTWWAMWRASGRYAERGRRRGQYVMARYGDVGPYSPSNVRVCLAAENGRESASKLTEAQVREIRCAVGQHKDLAARYGVSRSLVTEIRNRRLWGDLPDLAGR